MAILGCDQPGQISGPSDGSSDASGPGPAEAGVPDAGPTDGAGGAGGSDAGAQTLIFQEGWESGGIPQGWDILGGACSVVTTMPRSGNHSLLCDGRINWGVSWYPKYPTRRGYFSVWHWFRPGYDFFGWGPTAWTSHWFRNYWDNWAYDIDTALAKPETTGGQNLYMNIYGADSQIAEFGANMQLADGQWHHVEQYFQANDPGQANGFIQVWLDGRLVFEHLNFEMLPRTFNATMIDTVQVISNVGSSSSADVRAVDDVELWTECPSATVFSGAPSCIRR